MEEGALVKNVVILVVVPLLISVPAYLILGIRPLVKPHPWVHPMPSARDYWVEGGEGEPGWIRHKWGRKWPLSMANGLAGVEEIPPYAGASGRLWVIHARGIKDPFLVFDSCWGAYTMRRMLFRLTSDRKLVPVADMITVAEIQGDTEQQVVDATFEDIDGDGIVELRESHREWIRNKDGEVDNWAIRTYYHTWDGTQFRRRFERLLSFGDEGPLTACPP